MDDQTPAEIFATALIADAEAHEAGRLDEIGEKYDPVLLELSPIQDLRVRRFAIAFNFWDGWVDARNHHWNHYPGISASDWPRLARSVADALLNDADPEEPIVTKLFAPENLPSLRSRVWRRITGR